MSRLEREVNALSALTSMPFLDALEFASALGTAARTMHDVVSVPQAGGLRRCPAARDRPDRTDAPTVT